MNVTADSRRRGMLLGALVMVFVAGSGPAPATAATSEMINIVGPTDYTIDDPCIGETIQVTGQQHFTLHRVTDDDGNLRLTIHQNLDNVFADGVSSGVR